MSVPYTCVRCNYTSKRRDMMKSHFNRKKPCPNVNDIELTSEIKTIILDNRVFHKRKQPTVITHNYNNHIQTVNNVYNINPDVKINHLMEYMNKEIPDILNHSYFTRMKHSMINHKYRHMIDEDCRHIEDIFKEIIDFLQSFFDEDYNENNVYNCFIKSNIFHIFVDNEWDKRTVTNGMKRFINILRSMIFDAYELCLIRQLTEWKKRSKATESLKEYYSFIYSFDNYPIFTEGYDNDNKLLYNQNDLEYMNEHFSSCEYVKQLETIWHNVTTNMKEYKKTKNSKQLKDIMINHSRLVFKHLDNNIRSKIDCEEFFKKMIT